MTAASATCIAARQLHHAEKQSAQIGGNWHGGLGNSLQILTCFGVLMSFREGLQLPAKSN